MWFFHTNRDKLELENDSLRNEICSLKQLVDELFSRENEQKGILHYTMEEKEKKIKDLESKIAMLEDTIEDMKHMGKRVKKSKE